MKKRWILFALFTVLCVLGCTKISDYYEDYRDLYDNLDISIVKSGISWKYYEYANGYSDEATAQTASLAIKIKNNGSYLDNATASLSTNHKDVTLRDSSSHSFELYSGGDYIIEFENSDTGYYYTFSVPLNFSEDEKIPFTITFTDSHGNTQKRKIEVALSDEIDLETEYNSISSGTLSVELVDYAVKEYENGNDDGVANAGESLYLDIKFWNTGNEDLSNVTTTLSTSGDYASYVSIVRNSCEFGDMKAKYYYTLGYRGDTDGDWNSSGVSFMYSSFSAYGSYSYKERAFIFSISSDCPYSEIPFTITFSDSSGNEYTDYLLIPVSSMSSSSINLYAGTNYKLYEYYKESGNTILNSTYATLNGEADAGENLYLDIKFQNNGTGTVKGITVSLSTSSPYVTINRGVSSTIESLAAGASSTLTNAYGYFRDTSGDLKDRAFSFSISSDCPSGEPLLFTLMFTDSSGNEYIDYLNLQVQ